MKIGWGSEIQIDSRFEVNEDLINSEHEMRFYPKMNRDSILKTSKAGSFSIDYWRRFEQSLRWAMIGSVPRTLENFEWRGETREEMTSTVRLMLGSIEERSFEERPWDLKSCCFGQNH